MTCTFRCGNACDHPEPNTSGNHHIRELLERAVARRSVLGGAAAGSAALVVGGLVHPSTAAAVTGRAPAVPGVGDLTFDPVAPNKRDNVTVPVGYDYDVVIGWGDKVVEGAPRFDVYRQTPDAQAQQFGYNCDYVSVQAIPGKPDRFALVVNHEYTDEFLMFPTGVYSDNEVRRIAMMAHGMSVVEVQRGDREGSYRRVPVGRTTLNRRITVSSPFELTGPAAGDERLRTRDDRAGTRVLGTLNNCAGGTTPWGTVLSGEENFNQYFEASGGLNPLYADSYARYGIIAEQEFGRGWHEVDPPLRPVEDSARAVPLRVGGGARPAGPHLHPEEAHDAGPLQARGCLRRPQPRRSRGGVLRRRRAGRLHLPLRVAQEIPPRRHGSRPRAQPDPARHGHAVRRQVRRRGGGPGAGVRRLPRVDPADE